MAPDAGILTGQLPLHGAVLCCTSLPQDVRTSLAEVAVQMGAVHKLDLTSDVTHLIVGSITTPKYRYVAKERPDIKVLHPDWLEAVRQTWMEGGDVDVETLEQQHRFPCFSGLQICVTGFDNLEQRTWISSTVEENGATYHGDLTKTVTHLIAAAPQGDKYTHAKRWGITVVSLKWLEDSLQRGMTVDENCYDPTMPAEEQGKDAFVRHVGKRTSLGKRGRSGETHIADPGRKKLRRTASTRLESQSQDMWLDMSAENVTAETADKDQWKDDGSLSTLHVSESSSKVSAMVNTGIDRGASVHQSEPANDATGLFRGCHVLIHGFEQQRSDLLVDVLQKNGGQIAHSLPELEDASCTPFFKERYLLVPHALTGPPIDLPEVPAGTDTVTEWWVERCIHYKRLLSPETDALSQPLWHVNHPDFSNVLVSTTGFAGVDLRQVAEAVKLMGATYQEKILPSSTVLVSASDSVKKEKAFYASKHRIPVVSAEWFWACLRRRKRAPFNEYTLRLPAFGLKDFVEDQSSKSPSSNASPGKGSEDSGKKKDDSHSKRLSSSRRRHATPSLALKTAGTKPSTMPSTLKAPAHGIEDNFAQVATEENPRPAPALVNKPGSQPLQELSPNLSPRKANTVREGYVDNKGMNEGCTFASEPGNASVGKPESPSTLPADREQAPDAQPQCLSRPQSDLTADIADLLNRQVTSRPSSAANDPPQKRKNRPLGRASSGISNRSISASSLAQTDALPPRLTAGMEPSESNRLSGIGVVQPPPSTQLGYESLEAEAHRLQMSKKMGTKLDDDADTRRLPSLGVVKDTSLNADSGVANRIKGRGRAK